MDETWKERVGREPDFTSWWCVLANVLEEPHENNETGKPPGTKHFLPGETVACIDIYPNDNKNIIVLGKHRDTRRFIEIVIRRKWLTNFRTELVEFPVAISYLRKSRRIRNQWVKNENSKERCDRFAEWLASEEPQIREIMRNENRWTVTFDNEEASILSLTDFRRVLSRVQACEHAELRMNHAIHGWLTLLTNKRCQRAFVESKFGDMYYLQSYDPDYTGEKVKTDLLRQSEERGEEWTETDDEKEPMVDFILSNGQHDDIEISRTAPLVEAIQAVEHFFQSGWMSKVIRTQRLPNTG